MEQLFIEVGLGVSMGALIAFLSFVAGTAAWDNRLFVYTAVIGVFTSLTVIEGIEGGVGEENILKVILMIAGMSFFANKGIQMGANLRQKTKQLGTTASYGTKT